MDRIADNYLDSVSRLFRYYKGLAESAMDQLPAQDWHSSPPGGSNNLATIVKHLSGNMLSRWTDFLSSDGEKPWRDRESEFEDTLQSPKDIREVWERGWDCLFEAIDSLRPEDLKRIVYIRNDGHTVLEAINRQLAHYSYHVGQIVYLAKQLRGAEFESLSIPKGKSQDFNKKKFDRDKERRHFV